MTELQDARLYGRAIRARWAIPEETKAKVVNELSRIVSDGLEESSRIAAAKAIIAAEAQNQKDEHAKIDEFNERILGIAQRCGIDVNLLGLGVAADRGPEARDAAAAITAVD